MSKSLIEFIGQIELKAVDIDFWERQDFYQRQLSVGILKEVSSENDRSMTKRYLEKRIDQMQRAESDRNRAGQAYMRR